MLCVPKTIDTFGAIENDFVSFIVGAGQDGFNWVGLTSIERLLSDPGTLALGLNPRHLWEIVCVRPTRKLTTEHFKLVTPAGVVPTSEVFHGTGDLPSLGPDDTLFRLTWSGVLVDGDPANGTLDRLNVVVELELRAAEKFLRARIDARWIRNDSPVGATPGRYAIWRVRFPIIDLAPASTFNPSPDDLEADVVGADSVVAPENHGVEIENPVIALGGDSNLGTWSPQQRRRNVVRPGSCWRQTYPGLAATQAIGYAADVSGRGVLVGTLDHGVHMKEFVAIGQEDSVSFEILQLPEWCYAIGNRPNAFTGSVQGDSQDGLGELPTMDPWVDQSIGSPDGQVPDTRAFDAGAAVAPDDHEASLGIAAFGFMWLGDLGANTAKSMWLGYVSPYDTAIAPVVGAGPEKWNRLAEVWREISIIPSAAFPLEQKLSAAALHPAAGADAVLEIDVGVNDGQEGMFGQLPADLPAAYVARDGVAVNIEDLITPKVIVSDRGISSADDVISTDSLVIGGEVLDADGGRADLENYAGPVSGRGYLRLFSKDRFYVAPQQIRQGYLATSFMSLGFLPFRSFDAKSRGVKPGDIVRIIRRIGDGPTEWPDVGRARVPVATDSETNGGNQDAVRIVQVVNDDGSLTVGRYINGIVQPWGFPNLVNNTGLCFEVEILRKEIDIYMYGAVSIAAGIIRLKTNLIAGVVSDYFPASSLKWAQVVEVDGVEHVFRGLSTGQDQIVYLEVVGEPIDFTGKAGVIRSRMNPIDFGQHDVIGKTLVLDPTKLNERSRIVEFDTNEASTELLSDGILGFSDPLVLESGSFEFGVYGSVSSAGRVLGPESDILGEGKRFIDDGYAVATPGGFKAKVQPGDLLYLLDAVESGNLGPFTVVEVLRDNQFLVDRSMVTEGPGVSYRIIRKGNMLRDLRSDRSPARRWVAGPRALAVDGRDRVHFLAIGWILDPSLPITGVFDVDSKAWADLGANPFVPAPSANLTTYELNRGVRKPSQEFVVAQVISDSELRVVPGWSIEDSTFDVTFSDVGQKTFTKNVVQYRIVRDDRAIAGAQTFIGLPAAMQAWATSLQSSALFAVLRNWQHSLLGHDQPDFRPARGSFLDVLKKLEFAAAAALDPLALRPSSQIDADFRMVAAAYFNRYGLTTEPDDGESEEFLDPQVKHGRDVLLEEVLGPLVRDGVKSICFDELHAAAREAYGSPHFHAPPEFQVTHNGGGFGWSTGVYDLLARVKADRSLNYPADWVLGLAGLMSSDPSLIDREFPTAELQFPVGHVMVRPIAQITVVGADVAMSGVSFEGLTATAYGIELALAAGDEIEFLPSGTRYQIAEVGENLETTANIDVSGQTHWRLWMSRKITGQLVKPVPFFTYAFGVYATVAADVTFLANDVSWLEVVGAVGGAITREAYDAAVSDAFVRSMQKIAQNVLGGNLPAMRVQSEAGRRVPARRFGDDLVTPGSASLPGQADVQFPITAERRRPLISWHLRYLRSLIERLDGLGAWTRFGERDLAPAVVGATSLQSPDGGELSTVVGSSFRDQKGNVLVLLSCWATEWLTTFPQMITSDFSFADRDIVSGYWTAVKVNQDRPNEWCGQIIDVTVDPSAVYTITAQLGQIETRIDLVYEQEVTVRLDASSIEVDRVLVVPKGFSLAAAIEVIALDVVKGGSGKYVVVVGAGTVTDGIDIPEIDGATILVQASADEFPEIREVP